MDSLTQFIGLRRYHPGLGVIDIVDGQVELVDLFSARPQYSIFLSVRTRNIELNIYSNTVNYQ